MTKELRITYTRKYIRIPLSISFMARAKCKRCGGGPSFYYYTRNATMWLSPRAMLKIFDQFKNRIKRLTTEHYVDDEPKFFTKMASFNQSINHTSYRPRLHRSRGTNPTFDIVEWLSCDCAATQWAFSDRAASARPEIFNRKAKNRFPKKFED